LLFVLLIAFVLAAEPPRPVFPKQYWFQGTFSIPYFNITEPLEVTFDNVNIREYILYYNGMDSTLVRTDIDMLYTTEIVVDEQICYGVPSKSSLTGFLPDLSDSETWAYDGPVILDGIATNRWINHTKVFNYTNHYFFFSNAETGEPFRLIMHGYDYIWGSHPDVYVLEFGKYIPNYNNASAFDIPAYCTNETHDLSLFYETNRQKLQMSRLLPSSRNIEEDFRQFATKFDREFNSFEEVEMRLSVFKTHFDYIEWFNSQENSFKLAINHFADMTEEEFRRQIIPHLERPPNNGATYVHPPPESTAELPAYVNWRLKNAVTQVKDQGCCGSCWTFGTTGSLEGAWSIKTGNLISLSEQQIVDCAWPFAVQGCGGGYAANAFEFIMSNGGIGTEKSYPYLMQDGYCHKDTSSGVSVSGYVNVTAFSESALQDAVANAGPVAVAIDAAHPMFRFYTSGVYYNPRCKSAIDDLDHEVLAVGYGKEDGQDYWLVKNSWSIFWGDRGYIKMARNRDNNCGIASCANYPLV